MPDRPDHRSPFTRALERIYAQRAAMPPLDAHGHYAGPLPKFTYGHDGILDSIEPGTPEPPE